MNRSTVSIIICTRNRARSLRQTLEFIGGCEVPADLPTELLVVDNGSTDGTREVVECCKLSNMPVRYVLEATIGQCHARNRGLAEGKGKAILFTDDDVRVPTNWIEGMCRPILAGDADAVAGGVVFPPEYEVLLSRGVLASCRGWFASTEGIDPRKPDRMVGANMAFGRHILEHVNRFDVRLGPGALGFADETLFSKQLLDAGYRLVSAFDVAVEHHFDLSRLDRKSILEIATRMGRCEAYIDYHWHHKKMLRDKRSGLRRWAAITARRIILIHHWLGQDIPPSWELEHHVRAGYRKQYKMETRQPRDYHPRGRA